MFKGLTLAELTELHEKFNRSLDRIYQHTGEVYGQMEDNIYDLQEDIRREVKAILA